MWTITTYPYESCPKKCRNTAHGDRINSALNSSNLSADKTAAFIAKTCRSFAYVLDHQGQTALHVAASTHKYQIVEWLINNGADVNFPDKKSGQTALHHAIIYGYFDIALLLLSYGASFEVNDSKFKSPVQYCCKPKNYVHTHSQIKEQNQLKEIFVWGTNRNYNLGLENKEGKSYPFCLDYFSKKHLTINNVSLSCYHCMYVDDKGDLYAVGLGDGGRLGTSNESTLVLPKQIYLTNKHKNERIVAISTARNHSIVLTNEDRIFTCGLNTNAQLGQRTTANERSLILRDIETFGERGFKNVIARDYHCLAYTSDSIYVWGTNYGQFGFPATETKVVQPKKMDTFLNQISYVDSSNTAIVYLTTTGILLSTKYKTKKIKKPIVYESIKHFAIVGGNTVNAPEKSPPDPLEIIVLSQSDALFLWSNDEQLYLRCFMPLSVSIRNIYWSAGTLLTLTTDGTLLTGSIRKQKVDTSANRNFVEEFIEQKSKRHVDISETQKCAIDLKRVPNIDRITNVSVDQRCESFVILQENSKRYLTIPVLDDDPINFKTLLHDTTEFDLLHDIVFHVEDEVFPAHKYIVFSRAEGLRDIVQQYEDKHIYLNYDGLTAKMFELIMRYIYENHTLTMTDIEDIVASFDPYCGLSDRDIFTLFREYMGKFGVSNMGKLGVSNRPIIIDQIQTSTDSNESLLQFNRLSYPELFDVTIRCADSKEIKAHRCVLSTRLEYFNLMFNSSWSESTKEVINLTTIPLEYMEPIINYLYHNDTNVIRKEQYTDTFLYHLMEICDQFFVTRLKNIAEIIMIEKMNARKCADMFEFSVMYNCTLLETAALDYICQNMGRLLENRYLDHLDIESLEKISTHYKRIFLILDGEYLYCRNVSVDHEMILSFIDDFQIDLYYKHLDDTPKSKSRKTERLSSDKRNYEKDAINHVKSLSLESDTPTTNIKAPVDDIINEAEVISRSIESEAAKWMKVADKKDIKKRNVLTVLKTNELLMNEPKEPDNFTPLKIKKTDESMDNSMSSCIDESPSTIFNLSLGDFTPTKTNAKLSQKQRRRQLSQSDNAPLMNDHVQSPPFKSAWNTPVVEQSEQPNVWESKNNSDAHDTPKTRTQPINIAAKKMSSTSFIDNNSLSLPSPSTSSAKSPSVQSNNSFTKILADERKQKEYYNKMRSKSLLLTQIEETAIIELKKFYNVDNVFDENIEIERKANVNQTVNFARWRHE